MNRRGLFSWLAGLPLFALARTNTQAQSGRQKLKIMMKSAWGSDDPTRASFPFLHGLALADAGHEVQIFLTGEATYLMRKATANAIMPIGWPPLSETREKVLAKGIPVFS
jgi:predicted peroxiredoxin